MFGAHNEPLGRIVRVMRKDVGFEGSELLRQALEREPKFFAALEFSLPAVMRSDRAFHLRANHQAALNHIVGEAVGIGA